MKRRLACVLIMFLILGFEARGGDIQDYNKKGLFIIDEFAQKLCKDVQLKGSESSAELGGKIEASLPGIVKKFADLKTEVGGRIETNEYEGVIREDLVTALKDNNECKTRVLEILKEFFLVSSNQALPHTTSPDRQPQKNIKPKTPKSRVIYSFPYSNWQWGGDSGCGRCPKEQVGKNGVSVTLTKSTERPEDIQLHQRCISVTENQRYQLKLTASSDKEAAITVGIYEVKSYDPLHKPGQIGLFLSPVKKEYLVELLINNSSSTAEFAFYLGGLPNGTKITIHEIELLIIE